MLRSPLVVVMCELPSTYAFVAACVGDDPTPSGGPGGDGGDSGTGGDVTTPPSGGDAGTDGATSTDLSVDPKTFDVAPNDHVSLKLHGAPGAVVSVATQAGNLAGGGAPPATSPISAPSTVTLDAIGNGALELIAAKDAAQGDVKVTLGSGTKLQGINGRIIGKPGDLDHFFGAGVGYVDVAIAAGASEPTGILLQPDGKILVAGTTSSNIFVARFDDKGVLDPTFNTTGFVKGGTQENPKLALLADGSIVLEAGRGNQFGPIVWLLSSTGAYSDAWGGAAGYYQPSIGFRETAVAAAGSAIYVGGNESQGSRSVVEKFFPDAGFDPSWGTDGTQYTPETNMQVPTINAFTFDSAGLLWATGSAQTTAAPVTLYALDLRFVANGGADIDAPLQAGLGLAIAAQGTKAVIAARDTAGSKGFLFRNGGMGVPLDPTFGDASTHYADLGSTMTSSIAVDAESRILAAGNGRLTFEGPIFYHQYTHISPCYAYTKSHPQANHDQPPRRQRRGRRGRRRRRQRRWPDDTTFAREG